MKIKAVILFVALALTMGCSYLGLKLNKDQQRQVSKEVTKLYQEGLLSEQAKALLQDAKETSKANYKFGLWSTMIFWVISMIMGAIVVRDHALLLRRQQV